MSENIDEKDRKNVCLQLIQTIVLPVKPSFSDVSVAVEVVIFLNSLMTVTTTVSTCPEYITTSAIMILPQGVAN